MKGIRSDLDVLVMSFFSANTYHVHDAGKVILHVHEQSVQCFSSYETTNPRSAVIALNLNWVHMIEKSYHPLRMALLCDFDLGRQREVFSAVSKIVVITLE